MLIQKALPGRKVFYSLKMQKAKLLGQVLIGDLDLPPFISTFFCYVNFPKKLETKVLKLKVLLFGDKRLITQTKPLFYSNGLTHCFTRYKF